MLELLCNTSMASLYLYTLVTFNYGFQIIALKTLVMHFFYTETCRIVLWVFKMRSSVRNYVGLPSLLCSYQPCTSATV